MSKKQHESTTHAPQAQEPFLAAVLVRAESPLGLWEVREHLRTVRHDDGIRRVEVDATKADLYFASRTPDGKHLCKATFVDGGIPRALFNLEAKS